MSLAEALRSTVGRPAGPGPVLRSLALLHGAAVVGRFDAAAELCALATEHGATGVQLAETALQVVAYGGFPRAIETLGLVASVRILPAEASATDTRDESARRAAGAQAFEHVYGRAQGEVLARLESLVPGFSSWVLADAYGRVLSRPGLAVGERELLAVAALSLAALPAPLGSHVRGALRNGFAAAAVEDILLACTVLADARSTPVIAEAIDRLTRKVYPP